MKKAEIILAALCILSIIGKAFFLPASGNLLVLSLFTLAIVYAAGSRWIFADNIPTENLNPFDTEKNSAVTFSALTGVVLSISLISLLFRFMHWPGSMVMTYPALLFSIVLLGVNILKYNKTKRPTYSKLIKRLAVSGTILLIFIVHPLIWDEIQYRNYPSYLDAVKSLREVRKTDKDGFEYQVKHAYEWEKIHNPETIKEFKIKVHELASDSVQLNIFLSDPYNKFYYQYIKEDEQK